MTDNAPVQPWRKRTTWAPKDEISIRRVESKLPNMISGMLGLGTGM